MKSLSKQEFESECKKLQFRGKYAVLLLNNRVQDMSKVSLAYKDNKIHNALVINDIIDENTLGLLINLEISSSFPFFKVEEIMNALLKYIPDEIDFVLTATYDDERDRESAVITIVSSKTDNILVRMINKVESIFKPFQKCLHIG